MAIDNTAEADNFARTKEVKAHLKGWKPMTKKRRADQGYAFFIL